MWQGASKNIGLDGARALCVEKGLREIEYECALGSRSLASRAEYRVKKLAKAMKESLIESDFSRTELLAFLEMGLD